MSLKYNRVLIKISGESLGDLQSAINFNSLLETAAQIASLVRMGVQVGVVVGGGNIFRGEAIGKMMRDRPRADAMGMLGTAINAIALEDALIQVGIEAKMMSAIEMNKICEPFVARNALPFIESGGVIVFACGTGLPFFSTDTAAAMRAAEIGADALLLAKKIDAVYSDDPQSFDHNNGGTLKRYVSMSYDDYIERKLKAFDMTCATFCKARSLPIVLFKRDESDSMIKAAKGEPIGTFIANTAKLTAK